jgi:hypothetical protein
VIWGVWQCLKMPIEGIRVDAGSGIKGMGSREFDGMTFTLAHESEESIRLQSVT